MREVRFKGHYIFSDYCKMQDKASSRTKRAGGSDWPMGIVSTHPVHKLWNRSEYSKAYIPLQTRNHSHWVFRVGYSPQRDGFALPIRTCWYLKNLADPKSKAPLTQREPQRETMEYIWRWVREDWIRVGHVHFILFMSITFALGNQHKRWNMGLRLLKLWR